MRHQCHFLHTWKPIICHSPASHLCFHLVFSISPEASFSCLQSAFPFSLMLSFPPSPRPPQNSEQWLWPSKDRNGWVHALPNLATSLHLCCIVFFFWPCHLLWIPFPSYFPAFMGSLFFPTAVAGGGCRCGLETWAATAPQPTSSSLSSATCTPMGARALYSLQPHKDHTPPFSTVDQRRALNL